MTPIERARAIPHVHFEGGCLWCERAAAAIEIAVAERKEACAKFAEAEKCGLGPGASGLDVAYADGYSHAGDVIAAGIRAMP